MPEDSNYDVDPDSTSISSGHTSPQLIQDIHEFINEPEWSEDDKLDETAHIIQQASDEQIMAVVELLTIQAEDANYAIFYKLLNALGIDEEHEIAPAIFRSALLFKEFAQAHNIAQYPWQDSSLDEGIAHFIENFEGLDPSQNYQNHPVKGPVYAAYKPDPDSQYGLRALAQPILERFTQDNIKAYPLACYRFYLTMLIAIYGDKSLNYGDAENDSFNLELHQKRSYMVRELKEQGLLPDALNMMAHKLASDNNLLGKKGSLLWYDNLVELAFYANLDDHYSRESLEAIFKFGLQNKLGQQNCEDYIVQKSLVLRKLQKVSEKQPSIVTSGIIKAMWQCLREISESEQQAYDAGMFNSLLAQCVQIANKLSVHELSPLFLGKLINLYDPSDNIDSQYRDLMRHVLGCLQGESTKTYPIHTHELYLTFLIALNNDHRLLYRDEDKGQFELVKQHLRDLTKQMRQQGKGANILQNLADTLKNTPKRLSASFFDYMVQDVKTLIESVDLNNYHNINNARAVIFAGLQAPFDKTVDFGQYLDQKIALLNSIKLSYNNANSLCDLTTSGIISAISQALIQIINHHNDLTVSRYNNDEIAIYRNLNNKVSTFINLYAEIISYTPVEQIPKDCGEQELISFSKSKRSGDILLARKKLLMRLEENIVPHKRSSHILRFNSYEKTLEGLNQEWLQDINLIQTIPQLNCSEPKLDNWREMLYFVLKESQPKFVNELIKALFWAPIDCQQYLIDERTVQLLNQVCQQMTNQQNAHTRLAKELIQNYSSLLENVNLSTLSRSTFEQTLASITPKSAPLENRGIPQAMVNAYADRQRITQRASQDKIYQALAAGRMANAVSHDNQQFDYEKQHKPSLLTRVARFFKKPLTQVDKLLAHKDTQASIRNSAQAVSSVVSSLLHLKDASQREKYLDYYLIKNKSMLNWRNDYARCLAQDPLEVAKVIEQFIHRINKGDKWLIKYLDTMFKQPKWGKNVFLSKLGENSDAIAHVINSLSTLEHDKRTAYLDIFLKTNKSTTANYNQQREWLKNDKVEQAVANCYTRSALSKDHYQMMHKQLAQILHSFEAGYLNKTQKHQQMYDQVFKWVIPKSEELLDCSILAQYISEAKKYQQKECVSDRDRLFIDSNGEAIKCGLYHCFIISKEQLLNTEFSIDHFIEATYSYFRFLQKVGGVTSSENQLETLCQPVLNNWASLDDAQKQRFYMECLKIVYDGRQLDENNPDYIFFKDVVLKHVRQLSDLAVMSHDLRYRDNDLTADSRLKLWDHFAELNNVEQEQRLQVFLDFCKQFSRSFSWFQYCQFLNQLLRFAEEQQGWLQNEKVIEAIRFDIKDFIDVKLSDEYKKNDSDSDLDPQPKEEPTILSELEKVKKYCDDILNKWDQALENTSHSSDKSHGSNPKLCDMAEHQKVDSGASDPGNSSSPRSNNSQTQVEINSEKEVVTHEKEVATENSEQQTSWLSYFDIFGLFNYWLGSADKSNLAQQEESHTTADKQDEHDNAPTSRVVT